MRRVEGHEPHLLIGSEREIRNLEFSPDGRWVAAASRNEIWLWPTPDLDEPPFHTLPHDELLAKLYSLTNVRVVENSTASTGWRLEFGVFAGWQEVPEW